MSLCVVDTIQIRVCMHMAYANQSTLGATLSHHLKIPLVVVCAGVVVCEREGDRAHIISSQEYNINRPYSFRIMDFYRCIYLLFLLLYACFVCTLYSVFIAKLKSMARAFWVFTQRSLPNVIISIIGCAMCVCVCVFVDSSSAQRQQEQLEKTGSAKITPLSNVIFATSCDPIGKSFWQTEKIKTMHRIECHLHAHPPKTPSTINKYKHSHIHTQFPTQP